MQFLETVQKRNLKTDLGNFRQGDRVRVNFRIVEGNKERIQPFEGVVIRKKKGAVNATFTVRKMSSGVGVERTFPLHSPRVESVEVLSRGKVRQGRLYYLRDLKGKKARIQTLAMTSSEDLASGTAEDAGQQTSASFEKEEEK